MFVATALASALRAQTPASVADSTAVPATRAAASITAATLARQLDALTADSLRDRPTPSPGLERTARYLTAEFQRLGLRPGVQESMSASWMQRYPLPWQQTLSPFASIEVTMQLQREGRAILNEQGYTYSARKHADFNLATTAYFAPEVGPPVVAPVKTHWSLGDDMLAQGKPLVLVTGRQTVATLRARASDLQNKVVLYVPVAGVDTALRRQLIEALYATSGEVLVASPDDSTQFATAAQVPRQRPVTVVDDYMRFAVSTRSWPWAVWVWGGALRSLLVGVGLELDRLRADTLPALRVVPTTTAFPDFVTPQRDSTSTPTAPNVVGLLEGSDSVLKHQYVVLLAHMDNVGQSPNRPSPGRLPAERPLADSAFATLGDDNTAGVAALLALAQAFQQPGLRPRRSVLFVATSGGAQDLSGAAYFAFAYTRGRRGLPGAVLNLDRLDGAGPDTVIVEGGEDVKLELSPALAAMAHSELGLTVVDGGTVIQPRSDHFPLVGIAVPSLSFATRAAGSPPPSSGAPGTTTAAQAARLARVARLVFYVGDAMADMSGRLQWTPEARLLLLTVLNLQP